MSDFTEGSWALPLEGWDQLSTWGYDSGHASFFAQLTQNGRSDADGPQVWITPGRYPVMTNPDQLLTTIATATGAPPAAVAKTMNHAVDAQGAPAQLRVSV